MDIFKALENFNPFSVAQIRDFVQVYSYYKRAEIPIESVLEMYDDWLIELRKSIDQGPWAGESQILNKEALTHCPKCNKPMDLLDVSNLKGKDNLHGWKSVLSCRHCGHEKYSKEDYAVRAKKRLERIALKQRKVMSKTFAKKRKIKVDEVLVIDLPCPKCGGVLRVAPISEPKGKGNIKGWKSVIFCQDDECTHEGFSTRPAEKVSRQASKKNRR